MATWYVNSAAGGTGAGTSWVNACTTLAAAIALSAAGDDFNILSTHAETAASTKTLTFKGTAASPNRVFSCDNTNSPAQGTDLVAGASISATGSFGIQINGYVYVWGVTFNATNSTGALSNAIQFGQNSGAFDVTLENCTLAILGTGASSHVTVGGAGPVDLDSQLTLINTPMNFGAASHGVTIYGARLIWRDTLSAVGATHVPTALFQTTSEIPNLIRLDGLDLSAMGSGTTIFPSDTQGGCLCQLINCKLGASVTVAATPTAPGGPLTDLVVSDSSATGYRQERYRYQGTLTTSTTVYNNASDGVTPISWQVVTTANAKRQSPFECFEIDQWAAAGTYAASLVQITSATAALTNADVWVEAQYLGNGSFPISSLATSAPANQLTAGSGLAAGTWATGGLGHNYTLALPSFTPALAGYVRFTVKVAKASLTLNIDPQVTVA